MNWRKCELGKVNIQFEIYCQRFSLVCQRKSMKARTLYQFAEWKRGKMSWNCRCSLNERNEWCVYFREKVEIRLKIECGVICLCCGTLCIQLKQCAYCSVAQKWPDKDSEFCTHNARMLYSMQRKMGLCNAFSFVSYSICRHKYKGFATLSYVAYRHGIGHAPEYYRICKWNMIL